MLLFWGDENEMCFSGGKSKEQIINYEARWGKKLYSFKDVPALVCESCGDISFSHQVTKEIDRIIKKYEKPQSYEKVPVLCLHKTWSHRNAY